uniref:Uncharacterized protein n=1 Tax=Kwoniella dejecticola CBS 10117 TaxID=1296121 RepID=A0A1A6AF10_9TREE|nr:uncharacterized protein I303_00479 [Kwoniella dejecticola CBS 10117]OBR88662.1 hypothetical protein I303_00479 [Kwoniella dejecticola CBS 10117]
MAALHATESITNLLSSRADELQEVEVKAESSTSASRQAATSALARDDSDMVEAELDPGDTPSSSSLSRPDASNSEDIGAEVMDRDDIDMDEERQHDEGGEDAGIGIEIVDDGNGDLDDLGNDMDVNLDGKRVKVYELQDTSWHDRGTGFCKGIYDDTQDIALIIVEREDFSSEGEKAEAPGGFLKEELLLSARVEKEDIYGKQQDTLIVWTEPATGLDMALSFQDPEGCEDIWQFICEVQRHLLSMTCKFNDPFLHSPPIKSMFRQDASNYTTEQEMFIRMQAKSPVGREKAVEHILNEDYIKHLIAVLDQAEDLESLDDLHALCSLMQTIILFNDNGVFEYILQDDVFMGVMGMLEYDPEFPGLKASYRQYFQDTARFRQVVEIKDDNIRNKIHQTYRLLYLKDVVLARVLDDPTFNILNGFVFFNQVDIINYIQQNDIFLHHLFNGFHEPPADPETSKTEPLDERKRDVVMFLHQLMIMGKGVQLQGRLTLYRNLVERGLLFVCEWAFRRTEATLLHAGAEIMTLAVEHDANVVRLHVFKEEEAKRRTLVLEIINLLHSTKNLGLMSQMSDTLRTLLETPPENEAFVARTKEGPLSESFSTYFYENCTNVLFKPLLDAPDVKSELAKNPQFKLAREHITLLQHLVELLSFCVLSHAHKASYFVLSNPISKKVVGLLYVKDKPLRHAALRYIRACLKTPNHFMHRYYVKNDLFLPLLELLEEESVRDNMMSSACMDVLELIRRDNLKLIINHLFDSYRERIDKLASRAFLKKYIAGLRNRWEINNEPPPPVAQLSNNEAESSKAHADRNAEEEDYFNASDDEEAASSSDSTKVQLPVPSKRKRMFTHGGGPKKRPAGARQPGSNSTQAQNQNQNQTTASSSSTTPTPTQAEGSNPGGSSTGAALGLDYDDGSDSDSSSGPASASASASASKSSPYGKTQTQSVGDEIKRDKDEEKGKDIKATEELEEDLGDVAMRMRAKRQREEEEEEGFAGLLVGAAAGSKSKSQSQSLSKETKEEDKSPTDSVVGGKSAKNTGTSSTTSTSTSTSTSTPVKDMGKKIRLNLGFGKKIGGGK